MHSAHAHGEAAIYMTNLASPKIQGKVQLWSQTKKTAALASRPRIMKGKDFFFRYDRSDRDMIQSSAAPVGPDR